MRSMKFYEIRTTLPARGGITGDGNVLSKFSQMPMCYFGVLKDILSSLRKPGPRDCYYFCSCLGVSTFQIGRQGRKFFCSPPIHFPTWGNHFKDSPSPSSSAGFAGCCLCPPHLSVQEKGHKPAVDPVLTRLRSIPYLMGRVSAPISQRQRQLTSHWNKQSFLCFFL